MSERQRDIMSLSNARVYVHGRLRGLTKRRVAHPMAASGSKLIGRPTGAGIIVLAHSAAGASLTDEGDLRLKFRDRSAARLMSEATFKSELGVGGERESDPRGHSAEQLEKHSNLSGAQLRSLALFDVIKPIKGQYSYTDLSAARAVGRLMTSG